MTNKGASGKSQSDKKKKRKKLLLLLLLLLLLGGAAIGWFVYQNNGALTEMFRKQIAERGFAVVYMNFEHNKADVLPESKKQMRGIYDLLASDAKLCLSLEGHTDNMGEADYNMTLSKQRAEAIKKYLIKLGVAEKRLQTQGFGSTKPLAGNDTPEGRAKNRRVELIKVSCP